MSYSERDPLAEGACMDLPPQVVDKYFQANGNTERFEAETARAICGRCAVRAACLLQAIEDAPPDNGVRAGQSASGLKKLHGYVAAGIPAREVVNVALARELPIKRRYQHPKPGRPKS